MDDFLRAVHQPAPSADDAVSVEDLAAHLKWDVDEVRQTAESADAAGWVTVDSELGTECIPLTG